MLYSHLRKKQLSEQYLDLFNSFEITFRLAQRVDGNDGGYYGCDSRTPKHYLMRY
jgi:hypothetical protein